MMAGKNMIKMRSIILKRHCENFPVASPQLYFIDIFRARTEDVYIVQASSGYQHQTLKSFTPKFHSNELGSIEQFVTRTIESKNASGYEIFEDIEMHNERINFNTLQLRQPELISPSDEEVVDFLFRQYRRSYSVIPLPSGQRACIEMHNEKIQAKAISNIKLNIPIAALSDLKKIIEKYDELRSAYLDVIITQQNIYIVDVIALNDRYCHGIREQREAILIPFFTGYKRVHLLQSFRRDIARSWIFDQRPPCTLPFATVSLLVLDNKRGYEQGLQIPSNIAAWQVRWSQTVNLIPMRSEGAAIPVASYCPDNDSLNICAVLPAYGRVFESYEPITVAVSSCGAAVEYLEIIGPAIGTEMTECIDPIKQLSNFAVSPAAQGI